jgi:hypothetical protein
VQLERVLLQLHVLVHLLVVADLVVGKRVLRTGSASYGGSHEPKKIATIPRPALF